MKKPYIKCTPHIKRREMNSIMKKLDHDGFYTIDSMIRGLGYASNEERIRFEMANASLEMRLDDLPVLIEELQDILEEIQFRKRRGLKLSNENRVD